MPNFDCDCRALIRMSELRLRLQSPDRQGGSKSRDCKVPSESQHSLTVAALSVPSESQHSLTVAAPCALSESQRLLMVAAREVRSGSLRPARRG
jgi:hypothetical protein